MSDVMAAQQGTDPVDWTFLQAIALVNTCEGEEAAVYVHPLEKRSASLLSSRILEMFTELLGSESGSEVGCGEAPLLTPGGGGSDRRLAIRPEKKKTGQSSSFPSPLMSVGSSTGVQMRSRREGGRLVVEAAVVPSGRSFFHMERSHGRVKARVSEESKAEGEEEEEAEA